MRILPSSGLSSVKGHQTLQMPNWKDWKLLKWLSGGCISPSVWIPVSPVNWKDGRKNTNILTQANTTSIETMFI
ncbi:hypothetical protein Y1Q_0015705 [Alligator mississippiensis]|uniref:Uncharacterized protein n=1 Tax=Alligator mississippiensis TaxID=8496 RepID=A0A151NNP8_ALLMI|nr:hypothetical protein Y1Q_0015705 [Alligator mississippiensis]